MIEVSSLEQIQGNISSPTLFPKVLLLLYIWKMIILSWPILCTSSCWLQPCSAPFPPSEPTRWWLHLWYVKHTCTLRATIFFCSCHYFVGLCKFCLSRHNLRLLSLKISPLPYTVVKTEGNYFIQVTLWRPENAVYSHERCNFSLHIRKWAIDIIMVPRSRCSLTHNFWPLKNITFWTCLQWAKVTDFKGKYLNQQHLHANVHYSGILTHDPTVRAWRYHFAIKRYFMVNWLYPKIIGKEACRGKTNPVWHKMLALLDVSREEFKRLLCA